MFKKFVQLSAMAAATQAGQHAKEANQTLEEANKASDHWAVIVAGSRGYMNYRHHADVCHAYKQAIENGFKEDQVILIAYDDVAQARENPYPGKLFNKPTKMGVKGVDVYEGCNIDYKGKEATAETVLGVLKGDPSVGKKYLKSTENSKVFFYFADHGAPGLVAMPVGKYLYADELNKAIDYMHENKMYKEMVMYIEACESGSMFPKLKDNIGVYTTTAANAHESSWGTYCSPDDEVDGKHIGSCLGDLYSVNWMEDTDKAMKNEEMGSETLETQFKNVKDKTKKSHVLQFGDLKMTKEVIGEFEAAKFETPKGDFWSSFKSIGKDLLKDEIGWEDAETARLNDFAVDTRDIKLHYLYTQVLNSPSKDTQQALMNELDHRLNVDQIFEQTFPHFYEQVKNRDFPELKSDDDFDCYRNMINIYTENCGEPDTYAMKYFGAFAHQCQAIKYYAGALDDYKTNIATACQKKE